jgi:hypothetical protein
LERGVVCASAVPLAPLRRLSELTANDALL